MISKCETYSSDSIAFMLCSFSENNDALGVHLGSKSHHHPPAREPALTASHSLHVSPCTEDGYIFRSWSHLIHSFAVY